MYRIRIHCTHRKLHFMNIKFTNNWKKKSSGIAKVTLKMSIHLEGAFQFQ